MLPALWISHTWCGKSKLLFLLSSKIGYFSILHSIQIFIVVFDEIHIAAKATVAAFVFALVLSSHILGSTHFLQELIFYILTQRFVMVQRQPLIN